MKINLRSIVTISISLIDDLIIILVVIWVMSLFGIKAPWWFIAALVVALGGWSLLGYRALTKNPAQGFENMVGKTGLAMGPLKRNGTVRIGHELWQASAIENIEAGAEVFVVSQSGLKLTVSKNKS